MGLRNILVHLDSGERTAERLRLALDLAKRHDARLVGVFAQRSSAFRVGLVAVWPNEDYINAANVTRARFEEAAKGYVNAEFLDLNRGGEQEILHHMTDLTRHFDMAIVGQDEDSNQRLVPADLVEQLIVETGRPILVIPYAGHYAQFGHRPLIAWNDSSRAARALNDCIPLIQKDAQALVVSIGPAREITHDKISANETAVQLACHGVKAEVSAMVSGEVKLMDTLLNRAADHSADLLALGAFGHYGFPMLARGSGTRFMLRHMTLPVMFSH